MSLPRKKLVFIVEADEFNHHFLYLEPDISIITFLDHDHTDIYPTRDEYVAAFNQFCTHTKEVVFTLPSIKEELESTHTNIQTPALTHFSFGYLIGGHNHANASLALAAITYYQKTHHIPDTQAVKKSIEQFQGLQRRVELLGQNIH